MSRDSFRSCSSWAYPTATCLKDSLRVSNNFWQLTFSSWLWCINSPLRSLSLMWACWSHAADVWILCDLGGETLSISLSFFTADILSERLCQVVVNHFVYLARVHSLCMPTSQHTRSHPPPHLKIHVVSDSGEGEANRAPLQIQKKKRLIEE